MKRKNAYTIFYAVILGLACAAIPTGWSIYTKPFYDANKKLDEYKNVLEVLGKGAETPKTASEVVSYFESNVEKQTLNEGTPDQLTLYYMKSNADAIAVNFIGAGLWGKIYGYIALEPDLQTVKAFTVYRHEETPGLGGEIEKAWFKDLFKGKRFYADDGTPFTVRRPGAAGTAAANEIDGISGATLTGNKLNTIFKTLKDKILKIRKEDLNVGK